MHPHPHPHLHLRPHPQYRIRSGSSALSKAGLICSYVATPTYHNPRLLRATCKCRWKLPTPPAVTTQHTFESPHAPTVPGLVQPCTNRPATIPTLWKFSEQPFHARPKPLPTTLPPTTVTSTMCIIPPSLPFADFAGRTPRPIHRCRTAVLRGSRCRSYVHSFATVAWA